ncbi:MAG: peptidoglycan DD-metalloendopeptidase family protein [Bacteroidota bacterium]|mgnify:CR=1 FL=1
MECSAVIPVAKAKMINLSGGHWKYCMLLAMAFLFAGLAAFSQPANNTQANAITLTQKDHWTSTLAAYTNVGATSDGLTGTCGSPNSNVWFKFQAATSYINFKVLTGSSEGTIRGPGIALWNSANVQVTCIANSGSSSTTDMSIESLSLVVGEWYNLSVQTYSSSSSYQGTFTIYVNDQITELTNKNNWCSGLAIYTTVNGTLAGPTSSCGSSSNNKSWFKFQAATSYIRLDVKTGSTEGTLQYAEVALWRSDLTEVACNNYGGSTNDNSMERLDLTVGQWYYVSVFSGISPTGGTFSLCANDQLPELTNKNNWCSGLAIYTTVNGTLAGPTSSCGSSSNNKSWFKFQAATSYIRLDVKTGSTEGTLQYAEVALWRSDLTEVACNNYGGSTNDNSMERLDLTVGQWYYISVFSGISPTGGTFSLCVNDQLPELTNKNNWCSGLAIYTTVNGTLAGPTSSCVASSLKKSWFKFQAATSYIRLDVKTGGTEGTLQYAELALWKSDLTEVACSNYGGSTNDNSIERLDLTVGQWYYASVFSGAGPIDGTFSLCANDQLPELTNKNNWCSGLAVYSTVTATGNGPTSSCVTSNRLEKWFKFQAGTSYIRLDVKVGGSEGTLQYPEMALWSSDFTQVTCANSSGYTTDNSLERLDLTVGQWYYASVFSEYSNDGTFTLCVNDQPPFDHQIGALTLSQKDHWTSSLAAYTNVGATNDGTIGTCGSPNNNVWFKFQAATSYIDFKVLTGSSEGTIRGPGIALWNSANTQVTCIANSGSASTTDMSIESLGLVVGWWYYVSVQTYSISSTNQGTFTIYVNDQPPFNHKMGAVLLTQKNNWCSGLAAYTNVGATNDGANSSCGAPTSNVWFKFQASTPYVKFDIKTGGTEGTITGAEIALWNSAETEIACVNSSGYSSTADVNIERLDLVVGEWYHVSVFNYSSSSTTGTFKVCMNDQPPYDYKIGAVELVTKNWCSEQAIYNNIGTTADGGSSSCGAPDNNVWFKFQAGTSYIRLDVKTGGAEGTIDYPEIALWNSAGTAVACQNNTGIAGDVSLIKSDVIVGEWYHVSVYTGATGSGAQGTFTFCVFDNVVCSPLPAAFTKQTTTSCYGSSTGSLTLTNSETDVIYTLSNGQQRTGVTGQALTWTGLPAGTYYIMAARGTCTATNIGSATVAEYAQIQPQTFQVVAVGSSTVCSGDPVQLQLSGSVSGFNYQLKRTPAGGTAENVGSTILGNGSLINFPTQTLAGNYSVQAIASTGCSIMISGSVNVVVNARPLSQSFIGPSVYCEGTSGATLQLESSQAGVNYQLTGPGVAIVKIGGGALSWPDITAGTYSMIATDVSTGCQLTLSQIITLTTIAQPGSYPISASESICNGGSSLISIMGSQANVSYQVKSGVAYFGDAIAGLGNTSTLPLTRVANPGSYVVEATSTITGCKRIMDGTSVIIVNPLPSPFVVQGGGMVSATATAFPVALSNSQTGISYQLMLDNQPVGSSQMDGTDAALTWPDQSAKGNYTVKATNTSTNCVNDMEGSATIFQSTETILNNLAFQYKYDARKRMVGKKVPGAEWVWMVYDNRDRLVMTQDGEQRKTNQWTYTKYDVLNRPVMTGIYTHGSAVTQAGMDSLISITNYFETSNADVTNHGYTNTVWPTTSLQLLTATYYDNYDFVTPLVNNGNQSDTTYYYQLGHLTGQYQYDPQGTQKNFPRVVGQVTGTKINTVGTNTYLYSVNYYDDKYRTVQSITQNHMNGNVRVTSNYDFVGKVMETKRTYLVSDAATTLKETFTYDHAGRLLTTMHSVNGAPDVMITLNEYNELGQLVDKKLYSNDPPATVIDQRHFKQSIDYRYNIRGWLTRLNDSNVKSTSNLMEDNSLIQPDLFGMNLHYNDLVTDLTTSTDAQYNGNISAINWSSNQGLGLAILNQPTQKGYKFSYDPMNRILSADYRVYKSGWGLVKIKPVNGDSLFVNSFNETGISYDLNGNILGLTRKGADGVDMDVLAYTYFEGPSATRSNKLLKVTDNGDDAKGFVDGVNGGHDYTYDANGNMKADKNKSIETITYNYLNLPLRVTKQNGDYVEYTYNAAGVKLSQTVYEAAANPTTKVTDYLGELIYKDNVLELINHAEGRIIPSLSSGEGQGEAEYQYHLKDHLGNVRMTFTAKDDIQTNTATMETANAATEQGQFINYAEAIKVNTPIFDHTNLGATYYSARLTGTGNESIGLAKSLSVMPGDKVDIEVFAKYLDPNSSNWTAALTTFIASIATGGGAPAGTIIDGGYAGSLGTGTFPYLGAMDYSSDNGTGPKAYLNYLVYDRNFVLMDFGFQRISTTARETGTDIAHERLAFDGTDQILIREPGYVYIWLSNENDTPVEVYFDDFKVTHTKSSVIQSDDYYPFGLTFNSYSRENSLPNYYQYNGKELQDELNLGWLDFGARMYMPEIGRWGVIDPMTEKMRRWGPYSYAFNNPIVFIDINGEIPWPKIFGKNRTASVGSRGFSLTPVPHPILKNADGTAFSRSHPAVDLKAPDGTPIHALAKGKVTKVDYNSTDGNYVIIDHGGGYTTQYDHIRNNGTLVKAGEEVRDGQLIAEVGKTGGATGTHLHLIMKKDGAPIDPTSVSDLQKKLHPDEVPTEETSADSSVPDWIKGSKTMSLIYFLIYGREADVPDRVYNASGSPSNKIMLPINDRSTKLDFGPPEFHNDRTNNFKQE